MSKLFSSEDELTGACKIVGFPVFFVIYVAPVMVLQAYVVSILWGWYVVPVFAVARLNIAHAYGLSLLFRMGVQTYNGPDDRNLSTKLAVPLISPLISLLFGWIGTFWL